MELRKRNVLAILAVWFIAAIVIGRNKLLASFPFPFPQVVLILLTLCVLIAYWKIAGLRQWVFSLPSEALVVIHTVRFIGVYFLVLYDQKRLPYEFAVIGGWGDIVVASLAMFIVTARMLGRGFTSKWLLVWNGIGFIDIIYVVSTAGRLGMRDPASMVELTHFPLAMLPLFVVPLIISTHIFLFFVLLRGDA